jgi:hypothetical protein
LSFAIAPAILTPAKAESEKAKSNGLCGRQVTERPSEFFDRLVKTEGASIVARETKFFMVHDKNNVYWMFTVPGGPAHPSMACLEFVKDRGERSIHMDISCHAEEQACLLFAAVTKQLGTDIEDVIQKSLQKK